jgi:hypothetical protein
MLWPEEPRHNGNDQEQRDRNEELALHAACPKVSRKNAGVTA